MSDRDVEDEKANVVSVGEHAVDDLQGDDGAELARIISGESRTQSDSDDDDVKSMKGTAKTHILTYDRAPW